MDNNNQKRGHRISLFWPLFLIALGVLLLLDNLDLMPWTFWEALLRAWPALLILGGLDSLVQRNGVVGPVILIGLGAVILLGNFNVLAGGVWRNLLRLWPVLLIAMGLDILVGRRSTWGSLAALVLVLAVAGGALWLAAQGFEAGRSGVPEEIRQPLREAEEAQILIDPAVATLHVSALSAPGNLVEGVVYLQRNERLHREFEVEDGTAAFTLETQGADQVWIPFVGGWDRRLWELELHPDVPLTLTLQLGAGEFVVDLRGLTMSDLQMDMGLGRTEVTLPQEGQFQGSIEGAIGETVIYVSPDTAAQLRFDTGLTSRQVPDDYQCQEDVCTSPGYSGAEERIELDVSQAIGSLSIRYLQER